MALFSSSKTQLELALDRTQALPGDEVRARITMGEADDKVQGARVELRLHNRYKEMDTDHDSDGHSRRREEWKTDTTTIASQQVEVQQGSLDVSLQIPADAPPTVEGAISYEVAAIVDRRRARDAVTEAPLQVLAAERTYEAWATRPLDTEGDVDVRMELDKRIVRPDELVTGTATLTPRKELGARRVYVKFRGERRHEDNITETEDQEMEIEVAGAGDLPPGTPQTYEFQIAVPVSAQPSFMTHHNQLRWYVECKADLKLRSDPGGVLEVVVINAPQA